MGKIPLLKESHTARMTVIGGGQYKVARHRVYNIHKEVEWAEECPSPNFMSTWNFKI